MKQLIPLITFLVIVSNSFCQQTRDVEFVIFNSKTNALIKNSKIILLLFGNFETASNPEFGDDGQLHVTLPVNQRIEIGLSSEEYVPSAQNPTSFVVNATTTNFVKLFVSPVEKNTMIVRGKIRDISDEMINIRGCRIELISEQEKVPIVTYSDSLGYFLGEFSDGEKLIGTDYKIIITHPSYEPFEMDLTFKNSFVNNHFDLKLKTKTNPPLVYYVKLLSDQNTLKSLVVKSSYFDINELKKGSGIYQLVTRADTLPSKIPFYIIGTNVSYDTIYINKDTLITNKYEKYIGYNITYPKNKLSIGLSTSLNQFIGEKTSKNLTSDLEFNILKFVKIGTQIFSFGLNVSIIPQTISILNQYNTLPGKVSEVKTEYSVFKIPELEVCYFSHFPSIKKTVYFFGINSAYMMQKFKSISTEDIQETVDNYHSFSFGGQAGLWYNFQRRLSLSAKINGTYTKLQGITYNFNYFGRADQEFNYSNYLSLGLSFNFYYNL